MMAIFTARLNGLDSLQKRMLAVPADKQKRVQVEINRSTVNIDRIAKRLAPVRKDPPPGIVGGRLRSSIRFEITNQGNTGAVFTDVEYAVFQEFGTSRMAAQPFLGPAAREENPKFLKRVGKILQGL